MSEEKSILLAYIRRVKQTMVWLEQLSQLFEGKSSNFEQFAASVQELEAEGLLVAVKAAGASAKPPYLANRFRIQRSKLQPDFQFRLHQIRHELHEAIGLERYFALGEAVFNEDAPYLQHIDRYLREYGLPLHAAAAPERSFALVQDEKWLTEKNGRAVLERIGLWEKLRVSSAMDPLMLAVNPLLLSSALLSEPCRHLIVENKTTFQALLPHLTETQFHTLIYGCGNKIVGNIEMFSLQYPVQGKVHDFYYFGDLDYEGIRIWHQLAKKKTIIPALPFYLACLQKEPGKDRVHQQPDHLALAAFLKYLPPQEQVKLEQQLAAWGYWPQEILSSEELVRIWREQ